MCFHASMNFNSLMGYVIIDYLLLKVFLQEMAFHEFVIVVINYKIGFENVKADPWSKKLKGFQLCGTKDKTLILTIQLPQY